MTPAQLLERMMEAARGWEGLELLGVSVPGEPAAESRQDGFTVSGSLWSTLRESFALARQYGLPCGRLEWVYPEHRVLAAEQGEEVRAAVVKAGDSQALWAILEMR